MTTDPIAAARALIEPLTGYTPKPWSMFECDGTGYVHGLEQMYDEGFCLEDARLIAASPDLRDMVATLADAVEAERAKVAAARLAVCDATVLLAHALDDRQIDDRVSERFESLLDALNEAAAALRNTEASHD